MDALAAELLTYKARTSDKEGGGGDKEPSGGDEEEGEGRGGGGGGVADSDAPARLGGGIPFVRIDGSHSSAEVRGLGCLFCS